MKWFVALLAVAFLASTVEVASAVPAPSGSAVIENQGVELTAKKGKKKKSAKKKGGKSKVAKK